jgi:hypothetical protein
VAYLLGSLALAPLAIEKGSESLGQGLVLGLVTAIPLSAFPVAVAQAFEQRPGSLILINSGFSAVGAVAAAIIVTLWR